MGVFARIQNGNVAELFTPPTGVSIADCFHAGMDWVDVTSVSPVPQLGWTYDGTAFAAPVAPPVDMRPAAQTALEKLDVTIIRCYERDVSVPAEWATCRATLRAVVASGPTSAALPAQPAYPVGT